MTRTVLLAIDTSTEYCSVALLSSDERHASASPPIWSRHDATGAVSSARVLPAVRELFDEAGLSLADCSAVAFGAGPGSFTGLRTAAGVAQGLAFGLGVPVVPVGTLLVCAESARLRDTTASRVLAVLDARMDEVYWADYGWDAVQGEWAVLSRPSLAAPDALVAPPSAFTLAGNAAAAFGERLPVASAAHVVDHEAVPHAVPLAHVALRAYRAGRTAPAEQAAPEYIRDKVAQTTAERLAARTVSNGELAR
ncbi:MAG TPA: tRNA (adenosine(37)-N6)-threonylcarbamoyltransferase complex dimerization subunit type 1 TsaB [Trinickia sp.]|jgi:tRNA threonylcarbamoyladenosine biosynthesis protein TsaB|uniref:tRNA (adenosine(37)-N6)-threonylcarbamoyltransferase complex dimerization subunit type 1 TsaB n=1 Tax=Trinickia sp. TaxID=2571163 RepID=UPI002D1B1DB9|nr:tRNA (adenosine(37)-N6)-threonylcarbamoyltransferase complex dimerization subunit type 1 TsaB [Trinickia sp.]HTI16741.1 tRNA (adenosine(37)-N6)-threonylcarbamoyltransferase complex dimerization subunit type 1 TsaB [Trinickia sp.]